MKLVRILSVVAVALVGLLTTTAAEPRFFLINNFRDAVFPSFEISTATMSPATRNRSGLHSFVLEVDAPHAMNLDITFASRRLLKPTHTLVSLSKGRHVVVPLTDWDFDGLYASVEPQPDTFTISASEGGQTVWHYSATYQIRSVNDCVTGFREPFGIHRKVDTQSLYAAYVDENDPAIDQVLHEAIRTGEVNHFIGYHEQGREVMKQMKAVWDVLQRMGVTYSSITVSSAYTAGIMSQHVRLANESLANAEANCVDGSVLLASIFRKIGLRAYLVLIPEHCYLAVDSTPDPADKVGIETTMIGLGASFEKAIAKGSAQLADFKLRLAAKQSGFKLVDVQSCRELGIQPLRQIHDISIAELIKNQAPSIDPGPAIDTDFD